MTKIGIFGGSFNPPHPGHIQAVQCALEKLELTELLVIPSATTPGKARPAYTPEDHHRLNMARYAFERDPRVHVLDTELKRGGISYTVDTLEELRKACPEAELILILGTDMFLSLDTWKDPDRIIEYASVAVMYRGQKDEIPSVAAQKEKLEAKGAKVYLVENPVNAISSSDLRRLLFFRAAMHHMEPNVSHYVLHHRLYATYDDHRRLSEKELERRAIGLLKPSRVAHVLGCRDTAVELAKRWGADPTAAARAALLHDVTKALDGPLQLTLCRQYGIILDNFSRQNPKTLHALTGSHIAAMIFEEENAVVSAIRSHTTGKANMNVLEKIIYVADYMEPNRDFPGVEELRRLAYTDLDAALKLGLEMTVGLLRDEGKEIAPDSLEALAWLNQKVFPKG